MYREHVNWHSSSLGRPMEFLWYGKFGRPVMLFPTSAGRYSGFPCFPSSVRV